MAFPLIPMLAAGASTYLTSFYLNTRSMESPDFVPRIGNMQSDARVWGLGAGVLSVLLGPAWPLLGAIGFGAGVASLVNYDTAAKVQAGVDAFVAAQGGPAQLPGPAAGGWLPGYAQEWVAPMFEGEGAALEMMP